MKKEQIAKYIDHTLLRNDATPADVKKLCAEALEYNFASVCINPGYIETASKITQGSQVKVCAVVGFPLGANTIETKAFEAADAISKGAAEMDMVINIGRFKSKDYDYVEREIKAIVKAINRRGLLKVIVETCLLEDWEIKKACEIVRDSGADFIKTSTGFSKAGATVHQIELMKSVLGDTIGIKASGGIRTYDDTLAMIQAGATRIGASASVTICDAAE
ncbi:MAG: deoxyribose-phosphate aldolase [Clostridiaceae bacterium]